MIILIFMLCVLFDSSYPRYSIDNVDKDPTTTSIMPKGENKFAIAQPNVTAYTYLLLNTDNRLKDSANLIWKYPKLTDDSVNVIATYIAVTIAVFVKFNVFFFFIKNSP